MATDERIQNALLDRSSKHFNQIGEIPFENPLLSNIVPLLSSLNDTATKILNGDLTDFTRKFNIIKKIFKSLETIPNINNLESNISDEAFIQGMKAILEKKTSLKLGRCYSMYKALIAFTFTTQIIVKLPNTCVNDNILPQQ